jgi:hypothetical protein
MREMNLEIKQERPIIKKAKVLEDTRIIETFQNSTLRPIIKMKHDVIIAHFKTYISSKKIAFDDLNKEKKTAFIESALTHDNTLKGEYRGMILGYFNGEEYQQYTLQQREINKRITSIITKRLVDQMAELGAIGA